MSCHLANITTLTILTCHVTAAIWNIKKFPNPDQEQNSNTSSLDHAHSLTSPYLTFGLGRYYTCIPALRPYQFSPMRNPDVTEGHSNRLWSRKFTSHLALVTCSMVVLSICSALSRLTSLDYKSFATTIRQGGRHSWGITLHRSRNKFTKVRSNLFFRSRSNKQIHVQQTTG